MKKKIYSILFILYSLQAQTFSIARIHYGGGGDWYSDPSSIPNLLNYLSKNTAISTNIEEIRIKLTDEDANQHPYLYLTGHGNIKFSDDEVIALRSILMNNGFLHADDNYGMDKSFRREMEKVFPDKDWVELPINHPIFNIHYEFNNGLPKIHEHNNRRPQALALFHNKKIIAIYTYESDLGDGWENQDVHGNKQESRLEALKMGTNIVVYSLLR